MIPKAIEGTQKHIIDFGQPPYMNEVSVPVLVIWKINGLPQKNFSSKPSWLCFNKLLWKR